MRQVLMLLAVWSLVAAVPCALVLLTVGMDDALLLAVLVLAGLLARHLVSEPHRT